MLEPVCAGEIIAARLLIPVRIEYLLSHKILPIAVKTVLSPTPTPVLFTDVKLYIYRFPRVEVYMPPSIKNLFNLCNKFSDTGNTN